MSLAIPDETGHDRAVTTTPAFTRHTNSATPTGESSSAPVNLNHSNLMLSLNLIVMINTFSYKYELIGIFRALYLNRNEQ